MSAQVADLDLFRDELVIDLRGASFVDCAALREILRGRRLACARRCRVTVLSSAALERVVGHLGGWPAITRDLGADSILLAGGE